jgi:NADH-quinone oxidoreductase subunit N
MFFLLIDLQSIIFFFLIAYNSTSLKSTEVSWKYFIVNGFASSIMLFGILLIFWATQTISFSEISEFVRVWGSSQPEAVRYILNCGFVFFLVGFLIKLGIFPFHQ